MMTGATPPARPIDMIFPGDTDHHGSRSAGWRWRIWTRWRASLPRSMRAPFMTASRQKPDFTALVCEGETSN